MTIPQLTGPIYEDEIQKYFRYTLVPRIVDRFGDYIYVFLIDSIEAPSEILMNPMKYFKEYFARSVFEMHVRLNFLDFFLSVMDFSTSLTANLDMEFYRTYVFRKEIPITKYLNDMSKYLRRELSTKDPTYREKYNFTKMYLLREKNIFNNPLYSQNRFLFKDNFLEELFTALRPVRVEAFYPDEELGKFIIESEEEEF